MLCFLQGQNLDCAGSDDFNEHTTVDSASFRCVAYLVEAAMQKEPEESTLGTSEQVSVLAMPQVDKRARNLLCTCCVS